MTQSRLCLSLLVIGAVSCRPSTPADPETADPGTGAPAVAINEILTDNLLDSTDDGGRASDWIELFNLTDAPIDLGGWWLSDELSDPLRHELPAGLTLDPGGHLVLWADGAPQRGDRHLDFKLDRDGEALVLTSPDGTTIDALQFGALPTDMSFARAPDGANAWIRGCSPTPGETNLDHTPWDASRTTDMDVEVIPGRDGDEAEVLFSGVIALDLELSDESLLALAIDPYTWVEGAVTYRGQRLNPVAVRLKGDSSFQPIDRKPSFKIKLDAYDPDLELYGRRELTLNNMATDITMLHEQLSYQAYRWMDLPAARAGHATVSVNDQPYGLYAHIETVDKDMIRQWFEDEDDSLFELWGVEFIDEDIASFELESGPDDRTRLQAVADALEASGDEALAQVTQSLDLEQFIGFWAVSAVIGQRDGYPYVEVDDDAHVYDDPVRGTLAFLPHGLDEAFSTGNITNVNGLIASRCLESETCAARWREEVWRMSDAIEAAGLNDLFEERARALEPWVQADTHMAWEPDAVFQAQGWLGDWIRGRAAKLETYIDR